MAMNEECESLFFSLPPEQFALLAGVLGVLLSHGLDIDRQNSLGQFLSSVGQSLQTVAAQKQLQQSENDNKKQVLEKINKLKQEICLLEQEVSDNKK